MLMSLALPPVSYTTVCCIRSSYKAPKRAPLDDQYILGLVLQHWKHIVIATASLLFCTASNLAAPILSGLLFETLVQQQPMARYAKVCKYLDPVSPQLTAGYWMLLLYITVIGMYVPSSSICQLTMSDGHRHECNLF